MHVYYHSLIVKCNKNVCTSSGHYSSAVYIANKWVPWLNRTVDGLSPGKPLLNPRSINMEFAVNKVTGNFSSSNSGFPCQYHSTIAPHSFIHLPPTLYNVFLLVLQFLPKSNALSALDTKALSSLNIPCHSTSQSWPWVTQFVLLYTPWHYPCRQCTCNLT